MCLPRHPAVAYLLLVRPLTMRFLWRVLNLASVPLGIWTGYGAMAPERLRSTNVEWQACIAVFLGFTLFALFVFLPRREVLHPPGLDRFPLAWGRDPLQTLCFTTLATLGMAIGAQLHISGSGDLGFWMVAAFWSMFAGLLVGQVIGYCLFRDRITAV
jgi:hypothetical protein